MRHPRASLITLLACVSTLALTTPAGSQEPAPRKAARAQVVISPRWKAGEARAYERIKSRSEVRDGKVVSRVAGKGRVEVAIDEARPNGYLVRWTNRETKSDLPGADEAPLVKRMNQLVDGMVTLLDLDAEATVEGIRNWAELRGKARAMIAAFSDTAPNKDLDARAVAVVKQQIESQFATKEGIEQAFTREPGLFFFPVGRTFTPGEPLRYDDLLANPLGGPPFPSRGEITLASYDAKAGRAVVRWTQAFDEAKAGAVMEATITALAKHLGRPPAEDEAKLLRQTSVSDKAEFIVDTRTGWVESFTHTRSSRIGPNGQDDEIQMRYLK